MTLEVSVICDGCGRLVDAARTGQKARESVRDLGGKVALPGGKDLCPFCVAEDSTEGNPHGG